MTAPLRSLPVSVAAQIGVSRGNRSAGHAAHWLAQLGGPDPAGQGAIMIVDGGHDRPLPEADCVIRLWDFQVGHASGGALASAVSGASAVLGHAGEAPLFLPADMPEKWCGLYGVILALAELWRRREGGGGSAGPVIYDVSAADVMRAFSLQNAGTRAEMSRNWRRNGRLCVDHGGIFPMGFFACRDGHVAILGRSRRDWRNIQKALGDPDWAKAAAFEDPFAIARDSAEADRLLEQTLAEFDRDDLLQRGLAAGAVIAPVFSQAEALGHGVFRDGFIGEQGPAMPFLVEPSVEARVGVTHSQQAARPSAEAPLAGLRCLELCWVWSGPMVGQILADLGAEVIKVESPARFDLYRTRGLEDRRGQMPEKTRIESSLYFHSLNRNKIGLALDLKQPEGLAIATRLAACSDLLIENFTVGTMARLGLGTEVLSKANPALVQLSMSGPGKGSAVQDLRSYGLVLSALAGAEAMIRHGEEFMGSPTFSISDPNAAAFGAVAALAGALAAQESGRGGAIDLSQIEAAAALAGAPVDPMATFNFMVDMDDGAFAAVSLPVDKTDDALPGDLNGRTFAEIAARAAVLGGQAVPVLELEETDAAAVFADCPGWLASNHPVTGDELLVAAPWRVDGRRPGLRKAAPLLGEGDDFVLRHILKLPTSEIEALAAAGVVGASLEKQ